VDRSTTAPRLVARPKGVATERGQVSLDKTETTLGPSDEYSDDECSEDRSDECSDERSAMERSGEYNKQVVRSSEEYRGTQCEYSDE
jgi:hypothetical protein